jgi:hypothetical protein
MSSGLLQVQLVLKQEVVWLSVLVRTVGLAPWWR